MHGSSVLLYIYSIGPSNTIGHKLWFPNCVRLGGRNTLGFPNFEATRISKAILEKEKTLYFHTLSLGWRLLLELNPLDLSQPQDSHVYAFPPLRYNPSPFVVTQIVNEYWFCSLLILGNGELTSWYSSPRLVALIHFCACS